MQRVKSIGVLSFAKISALCYGAMGLCMIPFFLLFAVIGAIGRQAGGPAAAFPVAFGVVLALFLPLIYAASGFVFGALGAFVYNVVAGWVGGLEVELETFPTTVAPLFQQNS